MAEEPIANRADAYTWLKKNVEFFATAVDVKEAKEAKEDAKEKTD
jgi:hypothetical protein